jgi:hypothetical protein
MRECPGVEAGREPDEREGNRVERRPPDQWFPGVEDKALPRHETAGSIKVGDRVRRESGSVLGGREQHESRSRQSKKDDCHTPAATRTLGIEAAARIFGKSCGLRNAVA